MLVELAIIGGNDFTGHFMRGRLRGKLGIRGKGMIQDIAVWVKQYKNSQNHPVIAKEMVRISEFFVDVWADIKVLASRVSGYHLYTQTLKNHP